MEFISKKNMRELEIWLQGESISQSQLLEKPNNLNLNLKRKRPKKDCGMQDWIFFLLEYGLVTDQEAFANIAVN